MTHTPTPWDYYENDGEPAVVTNDGTWRGTVAKVELSEDAAFIVRACNAHDALVDALRKSRQFVLVAKLDCKTDDTRAMCDAQIAATDEALKLARGE